MDTDKCQDTYICWILCTPNPTYECIYNKFLYIFVALYPLIRGFEYYRPVVVVDGSYLSSPYKGTFLLASTLDEADINYINITFEMLLEINIYLTWLLILLDVPRHILPFAYGVLILKMIHPEHELINS